MVSIPGLSLTKDKVRIVLDVYGHDIRTVFKILSECANATAVANEFYKNPRTPGETMSCIHEEVSEAFRAIKKGEGMSRVAEELADVLIYIFDFAEHEKLDVAEALVQKMLINLERGPKHGNRVL